MTILKLRLALILLLGIIAVTLIVSLRTLTTQPRYFYDEAVVVETARNFADYGKLDIMVAPGIFSSYSHLFNSTGYTVSLPLALIFKIFGVSFMAARLMMATWLVALIISVFYVTRKLWNERSALIASALIASFAPFYGNGMQIMGEVPGFVILLWGFYYLFKKKHYFGTGFIFALAAVTKPSIYGLILPAFFFYIMLCHKERIMKFIRFSAGALTPLLAYLLLVVPNIFSIDTWTQMVSFYRNPFESASTLGNIINNIKTYSTHSTILYFGLLAVIITYSLYTRRREIDEPKQKIYSLIGIYVVLVGLYFLKSPGWFRYIFPAQILILMLIYPALELLAGQGRVRRAALLIAGIFIGLQGFQLAYARGDIKESFPQDTARYLQSLNAQSIGLINIPEVASLIPRENRHIVMKYFGVPELGANPLTAEGNQRKEYIVFKGIDSPHVVQYQDRLDKGYAAFHQIGSYRIYKLK